MTEYKLQYRISPKDFIRAYEAHWKDKKVSSRGNFLLGATVFAAGVMLINPLVWFGGILTGLGFCLMGMVLFRRWMHLRAYRNERKLRQDIEVTFRDESIQVVTADGKSELNWTVYSHFLETPEAFLLYMATGRFSIIPKRAIPADPRDFSEFLAKRLTAA